MKPSGWILAASVVAVSLASALADIAGPGRSPGSLGRYYVGVNLDDLAKAELRDFGVAPADSLHDVTANSPTPNSIPGGRIVTTKELMQTIQDRPPAFFVIDVLGEAEVLPDAVSGAWMGQFGTFVDPMQKYFSQVLEQGTQGRKDTVLVFYGRSLNEWSAYNAALRAIKAGYTRVLWYRGGLEAWKYAGFPTEPPSVQASGAAPK